MTIGPPLVAYITHLLEKINDLHIRTGACLLRVITFIHQHRYNFFFWLHPKLLVTEPIYVIILFYVCPIGQYM